MPSGAANTTRPLLPAGTGLPEKGALPQELRRAVAAEIPQPLLGRDAQLAVDAEVAGHEIAVAGEAVRLEEVGDLAAQKIVAQLERLLGEAPGMHHRIE